MLLKEEYVKSIVFGLLNEEVQKNYVINAIKKRHEISFKYDSGDGDSRGKQERITVQPVAYGLTKAGNECFRGYQTNGSSETYEKGEGTLPGWRLFLLDKVVSNSWKDKGRIFNEPPKFNESGDKTMSQVLVIADFKGAKKRYEKGGLNKYNQQRREKNIAKDPYYYFKKNLAKAQKAPQFVMNNIANTQKSKEERQKEWDEANNELLKGNRQSIADMSKQKDFGDNGYEEKIGPQYKNAKDEIEINNQKENTNDYSTALDNGPQYKTKNLNNQNEY